MGDMPTLPGLDLSQTHYDRVIAAFPGSTLAEKAAAYRVWLQNHLIDEVERVERRALEAEAAATMATKMNALTASLPPRGQYPPGSGGTLQR